MRVAYTGHEALTFQDYLDLETGRTLRAEPGQVYDIAPASGRTVPEVPHPWFIAIGWAPAPWPAEPDAVPETEPDTEPGPEPEPGNEPEPGGEGEQDQPEG